MVIKVPYVDYTFYLQVYGGNKIKEEDFASIEKRMERYLDRFTFSRIFQENLEEIPYLKECICEMADKFFTSSVYRGQKEKKPENIDGYSVTYVTESLDGEDAERIMIKKLYNIAKFYLADTGLMYKGVFP